MPRLCLVTPRDFDPATFPGALAAAVGAGDVASLIVDLPGRADAERLQIAETLVGVAQAAGTAVLIRNDSRLSGRAKADGIHVDGGRADLDAALETFHPDRIVGVGGVETRHEAMEAGATQVDYVFFGDLDHPEAPATQPRARDLAEWWVPLFEPPVVLMAGADLATLDEAIATGAEFIALRDAVWRDPRGPAAAVAEVAALFATVVDPV